MAAGAGNKRQWASETEESPLKIPKSSGEEIVNISPTAEIAKKKCKECGEMIPKFEETILEQNIFYMHVENDVLYRKIGRRKPEGQEAAQKFKTEFLQLVCTLRNSNGGVLFIHVQNRNKDYGRSLDTFDERFEDELSRMIEDDTMYHRNYTKRDWFMFEDGKYQDYISLFVDGSKSISTQDYNTFMPNYGRIVRPKAREMAKYITEEKKQGIPPLIGRNANQIFREGERLQFYESIDKQFKRLDNSDLKRVEKNIGRSYAIVNQIMVLKLFDYISSFTKLYDGGKIFLGIEEEKHLDNEASDGKCTPRYHYIVKGIQLNDSEKNEIEKALYKKITEEMLWWAFPGGNTLSSDEVTKEVKIQFFKTTDESTAKYVIEVHILRQFPGLVFTKRHGPYVYMIEKEEVKPVNVLEWKERILQSQQKT